MKNFITNNLVIILFLFTVIFVIVVLTVGSRIPTPSPKPSPILQASPKPILPPEQVEQKILSTNIRGQIFRVIDSVALDFAQPQATSSVRIKLDPPTPFITKQVTSTTVTIEPIQIWQFDKKYTVKITILGKEYNFSFQTETRRGI